MCIRDRINTEAFCDYSSNTVSNDELEKFSDLVLNIYGVQLDESYLKFISGINGFELNGLNFYGTKEQPEIYILSSFKQNDFWKAELPGLSDYYLLGDGDMDFYCFDSKCREFIILTKNFLQEMSRSSSFSDFIDELMNIYL